MPINIHTAEPLIRGQRYLMRSNTGHDQQEYQVEYASGDGDFTYFYLRGYRTIPVDTVNPWQSMNFTNYILSPSYSIYDLDHFIIGRKLTGFTKFLKDKGL